ncbi:phosphotidylinositol kinase [Niveomyces insectorum RCEF 264]|uniref:Phosphotidylinositol kinase n=1 Tax=Niveomyces insectorum RCEF 264 TaxID=1081102 RepID=A0A162MCB3_9HYPO|nr:phosphotidylinositol kinase [Niveomyces insectorum RCEF 264]
MHPTRPGPADGRRSPSSTAPAPGPRTTSSATPVAFLPQRRPRVDSNPPHPAGALAPPDPKRFRLSTGGAAPGDADAFLPAMSAKVQGKQPEVIDLTGDFANGRHQPAASFGARKAPFATGQPSAFQPHAGAKKLVIKNLRTAPNRAAEIENYYNRTWADIEEAVGSVLASRPPRQPLERLYRGVEDLCLHGQAERLYKQLRTQCEAHLYKGVWLQILSESQGASNIDTLRIVYRHWQVWSKQSTLIRSTFSYLDRAYLINERSLQQINDMLITRFRRMVFEGGKSKQHDSPSSVEAPGKQVLAGMCELVLQDRHGDPAFDAHLLREAITMMHVFNVYGRYFEPLFLQESEAYLRDFAHERDATAGLRDYIHACETLLRREDVRCNAFNFDSSTKKALLNAAQRLLIADKASKLLDLPSITKLLDANDVASMKALYELLRLPKLQKQLRQPWEAYIEATGSAIVTDVARGDEMVVRLLLLRRSLDVMIRDAFGRDDDFTYGMREAFGHFINDRRVAAAWASGASKVGEMIAKYIDMLLRGGLKTLPPALLSDQKDRADAERSGQASTADEDAELDRQLDQGLELFRFIQGKDVFEAFYKKDLARRLLMGRSASRDAERNMLSKLKTECGSSLTHNLEQMFRDQELSRDEMASYKQWLEGTGRAQRNASNKIGGGGGGGGVDLSVSVLSAAAWPTYREVALNLPAEVLTEVNLFDSYYKSKHTGRQLTWMHPLGHCVVKARFNRGTKELLVSSFQAAVLMLFNQVEEGAATATTTDGSNDNSGVLSYAQIATATALEGGDLDRTLQSLACGKVRVLTKHPKGRDVHPTDTFTVNKAFTDPKFRIKINQIQLKETREENKATYERVAADRQFETQAAIVRIMKSRKTLAHAQLVAEVIDQTKSRGALDPADIKQNIEKLIEKDYLDREDGKYVYLA